jgi:hypothetical protein
MKRGEGERERNGRGIWDIEMRLDAMGSVMIWKSASV